MMQSAAGPGAAAAVGRVAIVTGANKGIGYFIALQLGMSGMFQHVLLGCRDPKLASQAVQSIQSQVDRHLSSSKGKGNCDGVTISSADLTLGDAGSHNQFVAKVESLFGGKVDVLVNNAAMAYKNADPTPFQQQCQPTLDVNFRGTVDFTEKMIPLLKKGTDPRIVNVASMSGRLDQLSPDLQDKFSSRELTMDGLQDLVSQFQSDVLDGTHKRNGWGNSNYGLSKLAVIAATKVWARQHPDIRINCCCPGYCKTDMTSQRGTRDPMDGARNAVTPATMENPPTGEFFSNYEVSKW